MMIQTNERNARMWAKVCEALTGIPPSVIKMRICPAGVRFYRVESPLLDAKYKPAIKRLLAAGMVPEDFSFEMLNQQLDANDNA